MTNVSPTVNQEDGYAIQIIMSYMDAWCVANFALWHCEQLLFVVRLPSYGSVALLIAPPLPPQLFLWTPLPANRIITVA